MNGVGRNGADVPFNCSYCLGGNTGKLGGRSVVTTECERHHMAHLECIRDYAKSAYKPDRCICGPGMSLLRNSRPLLEDACQKGDLEALKLGLELKPEGDVTSALSAAASGQTVSEDYTECFRTLSSAIQNHGDEHKKLCAQLATLAAGIGVAIAGLTTVESAALSAKFVALCGIVGEIANMYITGFPMGTVMSMAGFGSLLSSWDLSAFPHIIASISVLSGSVLLGSATSALAHNKGENIGKKRGSAIYLENGNTPLHIASQNNAYQCVKTLVDQWAGRDQQKWGIIKLAFSTIMNVISGGISASLPGFMEGFSDSYNDLFFLTHRWDVNTVNQDGYTPLHFAAENNSVKCLEALLGAGADINATDSEGWTALHFAAQNGCAECVKKLLDWSSPVNIKNNDGNTAVHLAAGQGHAEAIQTLLDFDSSLAKEKDNDGKTALHKAAENGRTEASQKLLDFDPSLAKEKNNCGETAAHLAQMNGHKENVKLLNIEALHLAVRQGDTETIQTLLKSELSKDSYNIDFTLLHLAVLHGHTGTVKEMLVVSNSSLGIKALHAAAYTGDAMAIQTLLDIDRSLAKEKDNAGTTALHTAALNGQTEAIQKLVEIDCSLAKEKDNAGNTALHVAACEDQTEAIRTLLEIDPITAIFKNKDGDTALHLAAFKGHTATVKALLTSPQLEQDFLRTMVTVQNNKGWTALDLAKECDRNLFKELLEEIGAQYNTDFRLAALSDDTETVRANVLSESDRSKPLDVTDTDNAKVFSDSDRSQRLKDFNSAVSTGNTRLISELLRIDSFLAREKDAMGMTALHCAAENGHTEVILTLLGFDKSLAKEKSIVGLTALHCAAENGHTEVILTLLDFDQSLAKKKDITGMTALHFAAKNDHKEVILTLLGFDQSLAKKKDVTGMTALHEAARNGHTEVIQTLLGFDQSLARDLAKEKSNVGWTALHWAADHGETEALQTLLDFDPSPAKERDKDGMTALDLAIKRGHIACKELLEPYTA